MLQNSHEALRRPGKRTAAASQGANSRRYLPACPLCLPCCPASALAAGLLLFGLLGFFRLYKCLYASFVLRNPSSHRNESTALLFLSLCSSAVTFQCALLSEDSSQAVDCAADGHVPCSVQAGRHVGVQAVPRFDWVLLVCRSGRSSSGFCDPSDFECDLGV